MNDEKMREEYEKWKGYPLDELNSDGHYQYDNLNYEWRTWQAAIASVQTEMKAIEKSQEILAKYLVPNSGISKEECISQLLGVLDDEDLVKKMRNESCLKTRP